MKTVYCDLFRTAYTKNGVVPVFESLSQYAPRVVYRGAPITYKKYAGFINAELMKLRNEPVPKSAAALFTEHKGSYVYITLTTKKNIQYKVSKMKKRVWLRWFINEYEQLTTLIKK